MKTKMYLLTLVLLLTGGALQAQSFPDGWKSYDLSKFKMGFSIMAPADAEMEYDDGELWIESEEENYSIAILVAEGDPDALVSEAKAAIEEGEDLQSFVEDNANGYLAAIDAGGDTDYEMFFSFSADGRTYVVELNPLDDVYGEDDAKYVFAACMKAAGL